MMRASKFICVRGREIQVQELTAEQACNVLDWAAKQQDGVTVQKALEALADLQAAMPDCVLARDEKYFDLTSLGLGALKEIVSALQEVNPDFLFLLRSRMAPEECQQPKI